MSEKASRIILTIVVTLSAVIMELVLTPIVFLYCSCSAIKKKDVGCLTAFYEWMIGIIISNAKMIKDSYRTCKIE